MHSFFSHIVTERKQISTSSLAHTWGYASVLPGLSLIRLQRNWNQTRANVKSKWDLPHCGSNINKTENGNTTHRLWLLDQMRSVQRKLKDFSERPQRSPAVFRWSQQGTGDLLVSTSKPHAGSRTGRFGSWNVSIGTALTLVKGWGRTKGRENAVLFWKYASQNVTHLNPDFMAAIDLTYIRTCWIDSRTALAIWDSDYELTPKMPFCSRQECLQPVSPIKYAKSWIKSGQWD